MKSREWLRFPLKAVGGLPMSFPLWKSWGAGGTIGPTTGRGPPSGPSGPLGGPAGGPIGGPPRGPTGGPAPPAFPPAKGHPPGGFPSGGPPPLFCDGPAIGLASRMATFAVAGIVWVMVALA